MHKTIDEMEKEIEAYKQALNEELYDNGGEASWLIIPIFILGGVILFLAVFGLIKLLTPGM